MSVIIGVVIGAGIYETAPLVFASVSSPAQALGVWAVGGALSLVGALCYAELASTYPRSGGDYVYLSRAFSRLVGFLFGWAELTVIATGSIGMLAYVFADYAVALFALERATTTPLAASAVAALTALNVAGVVAGKTAQNLLGWLKVAGLALVVVAGLVLARGPAAPAAPVTTSEGGALGVALVLVLYTYGGWNDAALVAAEVRDQRRNLPRALVMGTLSIAVIYLLVNAAFLAGLGFQAARTSRAIAADLLDVVFGRTGAVFVSLLVMISALSSVNALIFTGSRVYASLGADYPKLGRLGSFHPRLGTPVASLLLQLAITLALIGIVGTRQGQSGVNRALTSLGMAAADFSGHGGFDSLLRCTAPVFWSFFLLTGLSLFALRARDRHLPRPFRVPLYPVLPLVFCATSSAMLYASIDYAGKLTVLGALPVLLGVPVYLAMKPARPRPRASAHAGSA